MISTPIARTWLAFAAIGSALVHLALVMQSPLPLQLALAALGAVEFAWGVAALARDRLLAPRIARVVAIAPAIAWSLLVVTATLFDSSDVIAMLPLLPMAVATVFELSAAALLSVHIRRARPSHAEVASDAEVPPVGTARYLLGVLSGALVAGLLVSPALSATSAGASASSHGTHGVTAPVPSTTTDPLADLELPDHLRH